MNIVREEKRVIIDWERIEIGDPITVNADTNPSIKGNNYCKRKQIDRKFSGRKSKEGEFIIWRIK